MKELILAYQGEMTLKGLNRGKFECRRRSEGRPPYVPLFEQIVGRGALTPPQAVGAGHVPPAAFPLQRVCRKAAGRACPAPTAAHPF